MSKRGRPEIDDRQNLEEIADLLVAGKARSSRNAISKIVGVDDSTIRRLQRKWRNLGPKYMKRAEENRVSRHQDSSRSRKTDFTVPLFTAFSQAKALQNLIDPPSFKTMREAFESSNSSFKALRDAFESSNSSFKALQKALESSPFKALQNNSARQFIESMRNSPTRLLAESIRRS